MGVMICGRTGCDNIMCDRRSSEHGYICYECYDELVTAIDISYNSDKCFNIHDFMMSEKPNQKESFEPVIDKIFKRIR